MLAKERLLDIVENFILFDDSRAGRARKIVARNHQVLGVNNAVTSVERQEVLKREYPPGARLLEYRAPVEGSRRIADAATAELMPRWKTDVALPVRAHADLGRLGVFWHTQGSGKSYSMAFFAEKVRRAVPGNFTFLIMTDREDLDDQIWRTFIGCGITDEKTPRAGSGKQLKELLLGNHRYVFSLIHKFNQPVKEPYSERDDIIVISDEAHRTQMGKFARNMRQALPNASFIGFTGTPILKELVAALIEAIEAGEGHLGKIGFDVARLTGATGFTRIEALRDAVDVCYTSDETKRRFEIIVRQVFIRMKALLMEPAAWSYAERHDNLEAIYKKLQERRDTVDVTELLKELHRIVNEAIRAHDVGDDHAEGLTVDLSKIDFDRLREEFGNKVRRKHALLQDIRDLVEKKLAAMVAANPLRMDYYRRYQEIVADYNREKDRVTVEATFAALVALVNSLDEEQQRAAREGLGDTELALFDLMRRDSLNATERERVKQASKHLLATLRELLQPMPRWTENAATQAEVQTSILNELYGTLPRPPFEEDDITEISARVYAFLWHRAATAETLAF